MTKLISQEALERLWKEKLIRLAPRLKYQEGDLLSLRFKKDLRLDSLEIMDLYSSFMDLFAMQQQANEETYLYQFETAYECIQAITKHLELADQLHFKSSGTTSEPHGHLHKIEVLRAEVDFWASLWNDSKAIYYCTNGMHIYGFIMSSLLPSKMAINAHYFQPLQWSSLAQQIPENSLIIAFPEAIEHLPSYLSFPKNCRLVSSTAPLTIGQQEKVLALGLELYKIYGSTESAGIAYSENASVNYRLLPYWTKANDALKNELKDKEDNLIDDLQWQDNRHFSIIGRKDSVIQIGGHNVNLPQVIEAIKNAFPSIIKELWIRPMDGVEGRRLKAWLQINDFANLQENQKATIYQWIEENLSLEARPKHLTFSADKALNSLGKLTDWPIND